MPEPNHCSYLLRLWREHVGAPWRITLIPTAQPDTHQHFASLEACFAFVEAQVTHSDEIQTIEVTEKVTY